MNNQPVDDATAAYILQTRNCFEDLRQVASQIAGSLVLAAAGVGQLVNLQRVANPLQAATELHRAAYDGVRASHPTPRAKEHHECLLHAAEALSIALSRTSGQHEIDPILIPVRAAYAHLQQAANTLPGFEMVAFHQGCCGAAL